MEAITIREILAAVGGTLLRPFDEDRTIDCVDTDSRTMHEGSLFIPLSGERFDGHAYIDQALEDGALGCLTHKSVETLRPDKFYIQVEDTMTALGALARYYRNKFDLKVVGVTGSVGKTTTKDMVASVLSQRYRVLKTEGNYNNNIGVPKTLFRLDHTHQIAVIEMGMNHMGEIDYLTRIAEPDVAIITNVGDAHIENLGSRENTLRAKAEIFSGVRQGGVAVLNGDDPLIAKLDGVLIHPITWYGESEHCAWRCTCSASPRTKASEVTSCTFSVVTVMDAPTFVPTKMRMDIVRCKNGVTILNDTYNANPQSMRAAVDVLANYSGSYRVAVLGDMLELGDLGPMLHESVGKAVGGTPGIDCLVTVGQLGEYIAKGAKSAGMTEVYDRPNKEEAKVVLAQVMQPSAVFLCKASRGMKFEELTEYLKRLVESTAE